MILMIQPSLQMDKFSKNTLNAVSKTQKPNKSKYNYSNTVAYVLTHSGRTLFIL